MPNSFFERDEKETEKIFLLGKIFSLACLLESFRLVSTILPESNFLFSHFKPWGTGLRCRDSPFFSPCPSLQKFLKEFHGLLLSG